MSQTITRTDFLQGNIRGDNSPVRPPWSISEAEFIALCSQCGDCVKQCPTGIIRSGRGGYPLVEFKSGECIFCEECFKACSTGALKPDNQPAWSIRAVLNTGKCLAYGSVECRSCYDPCEPRAITMQYRVGAVAVPVIDTTICTGCGACYAPCPVTAIEIRNPTENAA